MSASTFAPPRHLAPIGWAWSLSAAAHALALAGLMGWMAADDLPASVGRRLGALTVRFEPRQVRPPAAQVPSTTPAPAPVPRPAPISALPARAQPRPHRDAPPPSSPPEDSALQAPADAPAAPHAPDEAGQNPAPPPPSTMPQAGASFRSLFAPLLSQPLGRSRWSTTRAAAPAPDPAQWAAQMQAQARAQQAMQTRQALQERETIWQTQLHDLPLAATCLVSLNLAAQQAHAQCDEAADAARLWGMLTGLVTESATPIDAPDGCLKVDQALMQWVPCPP